MEDNVKSFLDKIQELKDKKIKVDVLSTGKSIECSPLSFKQQKDIISTIADGAVGILKFQKIVNDIILNNTGNNELTMVDKLPIIFKMRLDSIGGMMKINDGEVDISSVMEKLRAIKYNDSKVITGAVEVHLKVPTLIQENKVIQSTIDSIKKDDSEASRNVGNIYTFEIVKYISKIIFGSEELIFSEIPVKDRYKIVDNLPLTINKEIVEFIQSIKKVENDALVVKIDSEDVSFDIDVGFFDS